MHVEVGFAANFGVGEGGSAVAEEVEGYDDGAVGRVFEGDYAVGAGALFDGGEDVFDCDLGGEGVCCGFEAFDCCLGVGG